MFKLILASQSPRRKELLGWLNIPFKAIPSDAEEVSSSEVASQIVRDHTFIKGRDILNSLTLSHSIVIASDTIVALGDEILEKPKDKSESRSHIEKLSGMTHQVHTGVAILLTSPELCFEHYFSVISEVTFDTIDPGLLDDYIECAEGMDKAGAYGIQGRALSWISSLNGSYSNVVGFPLSDFVKNLKEILFCKLGRDETNWREIFE